MSFATLGVHLPIGSLARRLLPGVVVVGVTLHDLCPVKAQRAGDNNTLLLAGSLYFGFINLFLILLRIFGRRN